MFNPRPLILLAVYLILYCTLTKSFVGTCTGLLLRKKLWPISFNSRPYFVSRRTLDPDAKIPTRLAFYSLTHLDLPTVFLTRSCPSLLAVFTASPQWTSVPGMKSKSPTATPQPCTLTSAASQASPYRRECHLSPRLMLVMLARNVSRLLHALFQHQVWSMRLHIAKNCANALACAKGSKAPRTGKRSGS